MCIHLLLPERESGPLKWKVCEKLGLKHRYRDRQRRIIYYIKTGLSVCILRLFLLEYETQHPRNKRSTMKLTSVIPMDPMMSYKLTQNLKI